MAGAVPEPWSALPVVSFGAAAAFAAAWCIPAANGSTSRRGFRTVAGAAGAAAYAALALAVHGLGNVSLGLRDGAPLPLSPAGLADVGWTAYVRAVSHPLTAGELLAKGVTGTLLVATVVHAARSRRAAPARGANSVGAGASLA
jgi:hypothetical protein